MLTKNLEEKDEQRQLLYYVSLIRACNKALYQMVYIRGVHLHSDFEMSSSKNLVVEPGFFVYFILDFRRLHRQQKSSLK